MAKRQQVDPSLGTPALQPAAAPVTTYYQPKVPQGVYQAVTDLSGLSASLARVGQQMAEREADVNRTEALAFAQSPESAGLVKELASASTAQAEAEARRKINQQAAQKMVRSGKMALSQNPWLEPAFQEVGAGEVMAQYNQTLQRRLADVSLVLDPKTGLPVEPQSPEKIIADTWKEYGQNPILASFYGAQVSNKAKPAIDEAFRSKAAAKVGQAKEQGLEEITVKQLSTFVKQFVEKPMTPDDASQITETMKRVNLLGYSPDKQTLILKQMVVSGQMWAEKAGPSVARQFLSDMEKVQLPQGGTLADNAEIQSYIDHEIVSLARQEKNEAGEGYRREQEQLTANTSTAVSESFKAISDARAQGKELTFEDWQATQTPDRFGVPTARVYATAKAEVQQMMAVRYDDLAAKDMMVNAMHAPGETPEALQATLDSIRTKLRPETYAAYQADIDKRKNVVESLRDVPVWNDGTSNLDNILGAGLRQIAASPEGLVAYSKGQEIVNDFKGALLSMAATHDPSDKMGMQKDGAALLKEYKATMERHTSEAVAQHTDLTTKIQRAVNLHSNEAKALIDGSNGVLSPEEATRYRGQLLEAQAAEKNFYESNSGLWHEQVYQPVISEFMRQQQMDAMGNVRSLGVQDYEKVNQIMQGARAAARDALDKWRSDPNADPVDWQGIASTAGGKAALTAVKEYMGLAATATPAEGKTKTETASAEETKATAVVALKNWKAASITGKPEQTALVFQEAYAYQGTPLNAKDIEYMRRWNEKPESESEKMGAIATVSEAAARSRDNPASLATLSPMVPMTVDDVIAGRMVVPYTSAVQKADVATRFAETDTRTKSILSPAQYALLKQQVDKTGTYDVGALQKIAPAGQLNLSPSVLSAWTNRYRITNEPGATYDVKGQPLSPFTFLSDVPDWNAFAKADPARAKQVAAIFGLQSPEQVSAFQEVAKKYQRQ